MYAVCPAEQEGLSTTKRKIMKVFELSGSLRSSLGKKDAKKLRGEGQVPCVLYGSEEPVHFSTFQTALLKLVYTPNVYLVNLDIDGKKIQAIMQDIQFHPVSDEVVHIDFLQVTDDKPVKIDIPVGVEGFAKGIRKGGKLQIEKRRLKVQALAKDLPDQIIVDVTELDLGESLRVSDIESDAIAILNGKSVPVVRVMVTRAARAAMNEKED